MEKVKLMFKLFRQYSRIIIFVIHGLGMSYRLAERLPSECFPLLQDGKLQLLCKA